MATQNAASTIISDYTGSLFASTKTFYAQNILTEHNFFPAIKYNILQNFSPSKKNPPLKKVLQDEQIWHIIKKTYFHSSLTYIIKEVKDLLSYQWPGAINIMILTFEFISNVNKTNKVLVDSY